MWRIGSYNAQALASKVSDRAWKRSVPPRGSGWVDDQHALLLMIWIRIADPPATPVIVLTPSKNDFELLTQSQRATDSLILFPEDDDLNCDEDQCHESWYEKVYSVGRVVVPAARAGRSRFITILL